MTGDGRFAACPLGRHPEFRGSPGDAAGTRNFAFGEDSLALRLGSELPVRRHPEFRGSPGAPNVAARSPCLCTETGPIHR
jgi:hypothetical protein